MSYVRTLFLVLPAIALSFFLMTADLVKAAGPTTVGLGTAGNFAVLAGAAISDVPTSAIIGNVGLSPTGGTAITGLKCAEVTGTIYDTNGGYTGNGGGTACLVTDPGLLTTAKNDLSTAYLDAAGRTPTTTYPPAQDLGGLTLPAGVYNNPSSFAITGTLTLSGSATDVWIFQAGSTLTTANSSKVVLTGGAQSCNVFWQVGSSATLNTGSTFVGNILAFTSIVDSGGSTVDGRLLAASTTDVTGAVTLNNTTITKSTCTSVTTAPAATSSSSLGASTTATPKLPKTGFGPLQPNHSWILAAILLASIGAGYKLSRKTGAVSARRSLRK